LYNYLIGPNDKFLRISNLRGGEPPLILTLPGNRQTGIFESWKHRAKQLKMETYGLYLAYKDPRTPWYAKIFSMCVVGYAFSPIDLIPDFIPVLGYLDDLILLPLGVIIAVKMIPKPVLEECRQKARERIEQGKPLNWFAGSVVILVWLLAFIVTIGVGLVLVDAYL
jgi:uncharacterized membrane protein YkvA (DUF1232 family)